MVFPSSPKEKWGRIFFQVSPKRRWSYFFPEGRIFFPSREDQSFYTPPKEKWGRIFFPFLIKIYFILIREVGKDIFLHSRKRKNISQGRISLTYSEEYGRIFFQFILNVQICFPSLRCCKKKNPFFIKEEYSILYLLR